MAERISEMVKVFDGTSGDVATWLKKVKLVARLKRVETLSAFIPFIWKGMRLKCSTNWRRMIRRMCQRLKRHC